jgi:ParB family chromosome partitioning protein
MKRSALGKGIAALIPDAPPARPGAGSELLLREIHANPLQPRRRFTSESLEELVASIRQHGVLQPVVVSRDPTGGYVLIAGERRWRAAKLAKLERIPAVVRDNVDDADRVALALIENLQREDLTPIEEARAFHHLRSELGLSQEEIASRVGKDRSTVANSLRLLHLPLDVQGSVDAGELSAGHARALAAVDGKERQLDLAKKCVKEGWSVRQLEQYLRPAAKRPRRTVDPETQEAADKLSLALGVRVEITRRRRGGDVRLRFASEEDLIRLFRLLTQGAR